MQNYSPGKNRLLSLGGLGTATQEDRLVPFPGRKSSVLKLLQTTVKWVNYLRQSIPIYDEFPLHDSMLLSNDSLKVERCKRHFPPWCIHHPLVRVPSSQTEPRSHQRLVSPLPSTSPSWRACHPKDQVRQADFPATAIMDLEFFFTRGLLFSPHIYSLGRANNIQ